MIKKIALILLFIGVSAGMAFLLYRFFFAGPATAPPVTEPPVTTPGGGGLPTAGEGQPGGEVVIGPDGLPVSPGVPTTPGGAPAVPSQTLGETGTVAASATPTNAGLNYYNQTDSRFYRIDGNGNSVRLSDETFPQVSNVTWANTGGKAVIEFPDQSKIVYDFDKETQVTLPKHWEDFAFSADSETIVAKSMGLDPDNRWLIAAASDGSGAKLIEPLGDNADKVTVSVSPDSSIVAFSATAEPVGFDSRDILPIGPNGENLKAMRIEGFDFIPEWAPDGKRLVYSTASGGDDYLPALWVVRADGNSVGEGRTKLNVHTWADKCTFAGADVMYCAEPRSLPSGAGLQRDIADGTPDRLLKVDLNTGNVGYISSDDFSLSVSSISVSDDGSALFVADSTGSLTKVPLF
ncbi:MAG TPA: hypothetical protein VL283_03025 [Candidatus Baltobacteraceae bacterium]|nr:hypothetical protein [Candidatus Baltobacteraceae bacterium]